MRRCSWWVLAVRGENHFFCPDALPCVRRYSWWVPVVRGKLFFMKYGGPSGGSPLSGGGIIIFRVIRRHFLVAAVDPAVSLSMYSPRPMEAVPSTLTMPRREHQGGGRQRGPGRGRRGAGEDAALDAHAERSMRVHSFGCGVRLPSPQGLASGGNSRGW